MDRSSIVNAHLASGPVEVRTAGTLMLAMPKVFASGSLGWHAQSKVMVNDTRCQVNLLITVIGSKPVLVETEGEIAALDAWQKRNASQLSTTPEKAPQSPQELFAALDGRPPQKRSRKRS